MRLAKRGVYEQRCSFISDGAQSIEVNSTVVTPTLVKSEIAHS